MTNNFIGIYENVVPAEVCDELVDFFESCDKLGFTVSRQQETGVHKLQKHDNSLYVTRVMNLINYRTVNALANVFWEKVYAPYVDEFQVLTTVAQHKIFEYKMQRTPVGGGYHVWHPEQGDKPTSARILVFTCYLNDVEEGGETEFLYYPKRVKPTKGTFLLHPGGFTHTHRGNPPLSNTKYIVTGWVEFYS
jgi:hypothetical protein